MAGLKIQVVFNPTGRAYTYWCNDETVQVGDSVQVPGNDYFPIPRNAWVVELDSPYTGPLTSILRIMQRVT